VLKKYERILAKVFRRIIQNEWHSLPFLYSLNQRSLYGQNQSKLEEKYNQVDIKWTVK
jgi:hypothetical protein